MAARRSYQRRNANNSDENIINNLSKLDLHKSFKKNICKCNDIFKNIKIQYNSNMKLLNNNLNNCEKQNIILSQSVDVRRSAC